MPTTKDTAQNPPAAKRVSTRTKMLASAALDAHRASEHFKKHAVGGLYQRMLERSVENLNAVL